MRRCVGLFAVRWCAGVQAKIPLNFILFLLRVNRCAGFFFVFVVVGVGVSVSVGIPD